MKAQQFPVDDLTEPGAVRFLDIPCGPCTDVCNGRRVVHARADDISNELADCRPMDHSEGVWLAETFDGLWDSSKRLPAATGTRSRQLIRRLPNTDKEDIPD